MKKTKKQLGLTNIFLILVLVGSLSFFSGCTQAPDNENSIKLDPRATPNVTDSSIKQEGLNNGAIALTGIQISFKLDAGLTQGTYMGERWVSPPSYDSVKTGKTFTVEARAQGIDAKGKLMDIIPEWTPDDPDMVAVTPRQGHQVNVTVKRTGESNLQITSRGVSKTLSIKATYQENAIRVVISQ